MVFIMKYIYIIFLFFSFSIRSYGDWNKEFDEGTSNLISYISSSKIGEYEKQYKNFMRVREIFLRDSDLKKRILSITDMQKEIIVRPDEGVILKIRRANNINEVFAWEISTLFGPCSCVVPSFPIKIGGKGIVMQKIESFSIPEEGSENHKKYNMSRVSLDAYWKALLQVYLLGMGDLCGRNIGINKGKIRFFDVERSFKYQNEPKKGGGYFSTGFIAQPFTWAQFKKPLDENTVNSLQEFISSLSNLEEDIVTYLTCRPLSLDLEGFFYRLKKIRDFPLEKGRSFEDFYRFVYPEIGLGLDELCSIVGRILKRKVSSGETMYFIYKEAKKTNFSTQQKKELREWMTTYIKE